MIFAEVINLFQQSDDCMDLSTIHVWPTCAVFIIIFFICCQCSFTSRNWMSTCYIVISPLAYRFLLFSMR